MMMIADGFAKKAQPNRLSISNWNKRMVPI